MGRQFGRHPSRLTPGRPPCSSPDTNPSQAAPASEPPAQGSPAPFLMCKEFPGQLEQLCRWITPRKASVSRLLMQTWAGVQGPGIPLPRRLWTGDKGLLAFCGLENPPSAPTGGARGGGRNPRALSAPPLPSGAAERRPQGPRSASGLSLRVGTWRLALVSPGVRCSEGCLAQSCPPSWGLASPCQSCWS